eukprot:CAMPEP_0179986028 /NCGR_PEP_ID=MMETSP0984-20121128/2000_1 /TAXON_ID=483367 /ORGANISM="non described non described, Strain CCMP 2436" /LENGTH=62 /DNA_ID=CAMNT_0021904759 /DNA_START=122 /DNA_END=311 /DNA_ORIENTATION=-
MSLGTSIPSKMKVNAGRSVAVPKLSPAPYARASAMPYSAAGTAAAPCRKRLTPRATSGPPKV